MDDHDQPKNDDPQKAQWALESALNRLSKTHTLGALGDALLSVWIKVRRRIAGPGEAALALKELTRTLEEEARPGYASEPNETPEKPDDIDGAVAVLDETAAMMRLRGFSGVAIADASFAMGVSCAERELGRQRTLETLELLVERYRLGDTRAH